MKQVLMNMASTLLMLEQDINNILQIERSPSFFAEIGIEKKIPMWRHCITFIQKNPRRVALAGVFLMVGQVADLPMLGRPAACPTLYKSGDDLLSRCSHYHRPQVLNGRVRNGNGCGHLGVVAGRFK